jgi:hypothetical protein
MINTLNEYEILKSSGLTELQSKAIVEIVEKSERNSLTALATKQDLESVKQCIKHLEKLMMYGFTIIFAALGYLIFKG